MKNKRIKLAIGSGLFLAGIAIYGISAGMESLALACVGGIGGIVTFFIGGDSYRKSDK